MSNFRTVRVSKFRHVYGQSTRRENCYEGIRITGSAHDSQFCAVNPKFIAVVLEVAGGGAFQVLPLKWTGKVDYHTGRVSGHNGIVNDLKWNPFNDNVIASCSDDAKVKLWYIPDDGSTKLLITQWLCELIGHTRRVLYVEWHPTVEGVLASAGGDFRILLWNVSRVECFASIDCHDDIVYSLAFNYNGSLLASTCKDHCLRIFDARTGQVLQESKCHEGMKTSKVIFLGDKEKLLTTGFSRMSHRQYAVWDQHDISSPLVMQEIDTSSGVLFPFYDQDLHILYIAGKGDGNIRYYEILDEKPYIHSLSEFHSRYPQRGLGVMPKRGLSVSQCEIFRFYKVHTTQPLVEPLSFIVPRKSERFQIDLYPPTPGPTPALTIDEWMCGIDKDPIRILLRADFCPTTNKPVQIKMAFNRDDNDCRPTLITSDRNNERKFQFLSEITKPDYRQITLREDYPDLIKQQQLRINMSERLRHSHRKSLMNSVSSSSGDSPRRISIVSMEEEEDEEEIEVEDEDDEEEEESEEDKRRLSEIYSKSDDINRCDHQIARSDHRIGRSDHQNGHHYNHRSNDRQKNGHFTTTVGGGHVRNSSATVGDRISASLCHVLTPHTLVERQHSSGDVIVRSSRHQQQHQHQQTNSCSSPGSARLLSAPPTTNVPKKVRRTSQNSARSSPPLHMQHQQCQLQEDTYTSSNSFLEQQSPVSLTFTDTASANCVTAPVTSSSVYNNNNRSPLSNSGNVCKSSQLLQQTEKNLQTKPGRIAPGPIIHREPTPHIVRPFRVSQSQPPTPRSTNSLNENGAKESEIQKLYAQQSKRLRELMCEIEPKEKRIEQLERDLAQMTLKAEALQSNVKQKDEDIESLRYEIAWKNKRITQLEQHLYKQQQNEQQETDIKKVES